MWLASAFALVFLGFVATTGGTAIALTTAAYRGSWRMAGIAAGTGLVGGLAIARVVLARVSFAWSYLPQTAAFWLLTVAAAAGTGALWARWRAENRPVRSCAAALTLTVVVWLPLAVILGGGSACNLDAACY